MSENYIDRLAQRIEAHVEADIVPKDSQALFRAYAVICLAKGAATTLADVHNAWVAWMSDRQPDHPSLVPFDELPDSTQAEDAPFLAAIVDAATA